MIPVRFDLTKSKYSNQITRWQEITRIDVLSYDSFNNHKNRKQIANRQRIYLWITKRL